MKLFIDPQFWVAVSFLICMGALAKVMVRRMLTFIDNHVYQREQLLLTLKEEEKTFGVLLKQEQQRALAVEEERKVIKKKLKDEISALRHAMEDRIQQDINTFEQTYEKLNQNMIADFEHHLHATLVHNIMEGTREILRQPSMQKHQHKIVARHLKTLQ
jgi:F0F1-type ATP synthase membrane subunit b/b'